MKKKQMLAALMGVAMLSTLLAGCGGGDKEGSSEEGGVKEFTAFFAVPGTEINDDNEIQQKIAEITGAKCKETWLTGQTAPGENIRILLTVETVWHSYMMQAHW